MKNQNFKTSAIGPFYKSILLLFVFFSHFTFAQYEKVYKYDDYHKDWALVKTSSGTFGFIDKQKKLIVQPIYSKIEKFGILDDNFALVKSISDGYGLIDQSGKERVPAIYSK